MRTGELRHVAIVQLPVDLYAQARVWAESLIREVAFISEGEGAGIDPRLRELLEHLEAGRSRFLGLMDDIQARVDDAIARGEATLDLDLDVTAGFCAATVEMGRLLDAADRYCRDGDLLTVASSDAIRNFRRWYTQEFDRQPSGCRPTSWVDWSP